MVASSCDQGRVDGQGVRGRGLSPFASAPDLARDRPGGNSARHLLRAVPQCEPARRKPKNGGGVDVRGTRWSGRRFSLFASLLFSTCSRVVYCVLSALPNLATAQPGHGRQSHQFKTVDSLLGSGLCASPVVLKDAHKSALTPLDQ